MWTWWLKRPGAVEVQLDEKGIFLLPKGAERQDPFRNGTLRFWDLTPAAQAKGTPLAFHGGSWFVATSGGILQISPDATRDVKVYARSAQGAPTTDVTHLGVHHKEGLFARTSVGGGTTLHFTKNGEWAPVTAPFPGRDQPVESAWLRWTYAAPGRLRVSLRPEATDDATAIGSASLLANGRFVFDEVGYFAGVGAAALDPEKKDGYWYWLVTPAGVIRLEEGTGVVKHYGKAFAGDLGALSAVRWDGKALRVLGRSNKAWTYDPDQAWCPEQAERAAVLADQWHIVARNELFECRETSAGTYEFRFPPRYAGFPLFTPGSGAVPLLKDGVFGFDDVRDAMFLPDALLVATRLGVWEYRLEERSRVAAGAAYSAVPGEGGTSGRLPMVDLERFLRVPADSDETVVYSAGGTRAFRRQREGVWEAQLAAHPSTPTQRDLTEGQAITWRLEAGNGTLRVRKLRNGGREAMDAATWPEATDPSTQSLRPGDLVDAFVTPTSVWVPLDRGLLWIRKSAFR